MSAPSLFVLMAPARRRDDIVDALMTLESISGFSVSPAAGFSRAHSQLDQRERVQGFGNYERFEVLCDSAGQDAVLVALQAMVGRDRFRYWVLPVLGEGALGD